MLLAFLTGWAQAVSQQVTESKVQFKLVVEHPTAQVLEMGRFHQYRLAVPGFGRLSE